MIKKILLAVVVLVVIAGGVMVFGTYKAAKELLHEQEPQLRQYLQLTEAEQNDYILKHADEFISSAKTNAKPEEKDELELYDKTKNDPAVQKALVDFGRAIMAKAIIHSEAIVKDMDATVKAKYQKESDEFMARLEKYDDIVEATGKALKADK